MTRKRDKEKESVGGRGLLLGVGLVLAAGLLKYSNAPVVQAVRERAVQAIGGSESVSELLAVFGGASPTQPVEDIESIPTAAQATYASSSGGADDILGREKTLFPDSIDQTTYPMDFVHAMPAAGTLSSSFGSRISPVTGQPGFHYGLDIAASEGTTIGAFAAGTVREIGQSSYGNYLIIDHEQGFSTLYAHCHTISAKVGDEVTCGQQIATVGQTGNATGPHLHLELWHEGAALNPADYLAGL